MGNNMVQNGLHTDSHYEAKTERKNINLDSISKFKALCSFLTRVLSVNVPEFDTRLLCKCKVHVCI